MHLEIVATRGKIANKNLFLHQKLSNMYNPINKISFSLELILIISEQRVFEIKELYIALLINSKIVC